MREVGQAVNSTLDVQTVLNTIVTHAVQLSGMDGGTIQEYDEQREEFILRATHGMDEQLIEGLRSIRYEWVKERWDNRRSPASRSVSPILKRAPTSRDCEA